MALVKQQSKKAASDTLSSALEKLHNDTSLMDFTIQIGKTEIRAHKYILACVIPNNFPLHLSYCKFLAALELTFFRQSWGREVSPSCAHHPKLREILLHHSIARLLTILTQQTEFEPHNSGNFDLEETFKTWKAAQFFVTSDHLQEFEAMYDLSSLDCGTNL